MEFTPLHTKRLLLRQVNRQDAQRLFDLFSLDDVTRYYGMNSFQQIEQAENMIDSFARNWAEKRGIRWGMELKETGELIGTIGLNNLQLWNKRAEIGFETHPDHWRKGLTSEAIHAVLRHSFLELGLHRIGAVTFVENDASGELLRKHGFAREGVLRDYLFQRGRSHDAVLYSYIRSQWQSQFGE